MYECLCFPVNPYNYHKAWHFDIIYNLSIAYARSIGRKIEKTSSKRKSDLQCRNFPK